MTRDRAGRARAAAAAASGADRALTDLARARLNANDWQVIALGRFPELRAPLERALGPLPDDAGVVVFVPRR